MTRVPKNQSQSQKHETGRFWVSMLCTLGVSSRREQCSGATPAVPHLALVLHATWWVVDISADTANIRCRIIVGVCAEPNHAKAGCYSNNHHHNSNRIWARTFLDASHHTHTSNHTHASSGWRLVSACVRCACVSFACCCCAPLAPIVTTDFQLHAHQDSLALSFNGLF
jgi:hypothetical protein